MTATETLHTNKPKVEAIFEYKLTSLYFYIPSTVINTMATPQASQPGQALPLYDLFLDLPHPAAAASCPPPFVLPSPLPNPGMEQELSAPDNLSRIARFAFPEFDDATAQRIPRDKALNRFSQYAMQPKSFQNYTFSLQLQSGVRMHGFVRRYLPIHPIAKHRYDVGRRGERALVVLTRFSGGDLVYAAILKYVCGLQSCSVG